MTGFAAPPPTEPALFGLARIAELVDDVRGDVRDRGRRRRPPSRPRGPRSCSTSRRSRVVRRAWREPADAFAVNTLGTVHVLEAVRALAPEAAVVVVTTDKVYADPDSGRRFGEDDPLGGEDPYSASKAAAELAAASYRDSYGLRIATARAGNVIGGGDWAEARILPDAVRAARAGVPLVVRDPAAIRPWQHVLNPLSGYLTLAAAPRRVRASSRAHGTSPRRLEREQRPVCVAGGSVRRGARRWRSRCAAHRRRATARARPPASASTRRWPASGSAGASAGPLERRGDAAAAEWYRRRGVRGRGRRGW